MYVYEYNSLKINYNVWYVYIHLHTLLVVRSVYQAV